MLCELLNSSSGFLLNLIVFPFSEGIVCFRRYNEFSPRPSPLRQRCIMTHAMIWHSLRCGRLKSMSDTFQLFRFWFSCGFKHWRPKTRQLFLNHLCSNPDLYVISVLSDNLPRHAFPVRGSGLSQMTWWGPGALPRSRYICQIATCPQRIWRWGCRGVIVTVYSGWVILWVVDLFAGLVALGTMVNECARCT